MLFMLILIVLIVLLIVQHIRLKDLRKHQAQASAQAGAHIYGLEQQLYQGTAHIQGLEQQLFQGAQAHAAELEKRAVRAVAASRGSFDGHVAQQAFPYSAQHSYHPKDVFHFGGVLDYIVFDGLHDVRHGDRDPRTITVVFADVKWGSSRPTEVQVAVIDALNSNRTRGEIWQSRESSAGSLDYRLKVNLPPPKSGD